jgi:hypothetical protein
MPYAVGGRPEAPGRPPFPTRALPLVGLGAAAAVLWASDRPRAALVESPPRVAATPASSPAARQHPPRAPEGRQAREALQRAFGDALTIDAGRVVAGDFNDDGSDDLAAVARASPGRLAQVNDELANWIVQDAAAPGRSPIAASDPLLAVLHGHGAPGWRNPEARQVYLVRVSLARPRLVVIDRGLAQAGPPVHHVLIDDTPRHPGFLYWSGSRYVWSSTPVPARAR